MMRAGIGNPPRVTRTPVSERTREARMDGSPNDQAPMTNK